jgi:hypothetical protein
MINKPTVSSKDSGVSIRNERTVKRGIAAQEKNRGKKSPINEEWKLTRQITVAESPNNKSMRPKGKSSAIYDQVLVILTMKMKIMT